MEELSFGEKIQVLLNNLVAHPAVIIILLLPLLFLILNKKITQKFIILIYGIVIIAVLFIGNSTLFELFDNMMNGLFMTLYFPSFITLFVVEVSSIIITIITFFGKIRKENKIINIISFAVIQTLFVLVLTVVRTNNIDIYEENALYSNSNVLALMQLLMGAFTLQVISLVVIRIINVISSYLDKKENKTIQRQLMEPQKIETPTVDLKGYSKIDTYHEIGSKPVDKSLIKEETINPRSLENDIKIEDTIKNQKLEEEKIKENQQIELNKQKEEQQLEEERKSLETPLNRSFVSGTVINPINLADEINAEDKQKEDIVNKQKEIEEEQINNERKQELNTVLPLNKENISENKITPKFVNNEIIKESLGKPDISNISPKLDSNLSAREGQLDLTPKKGKFVTIEEKKEEKVPVQNNLSFNDFKLEFPDETRRFVNDFVNDVKKDDQNVETLFTEEPKKEKTKIFKKEEPQLISNLKFYNFDKTADILGRIKRVYTL